MDRITKQLVEDFLVSQEIDSLTPSDNFEIFANYCVVSKEYNRTFDPAEICIGSGNDTGIDGVAIIVNGYLVEDVEEVQDLIDQNGYLEATYIFIQAKTSSAFEASGINTFLFGVKDFFRESPGLVRNADVVRFAEISNFILENAINFKNNPVCKLYYVTTGQWSFDPNHVAVVNAGVQQLREENIFEDIAFHPVGASDISKLYRSTKNPNNAEFTFADKITLPDTTGVIEAYYGILPFSEFRKILIDDNGNIRSIFDDNVRDFQGVDNPVNKKINSTLHGQVPDQFVVLNNGVTVVASSLKTSGNKFIISDFQIVNGCQTSNVLYQSRDLVGVNSIHVPIRLIVADSDEVKSQITLATNSQTAIKTEQLAVLSEFQKNLELYYGSMVGDGQLYYERRAKQYSKDKSVIRNKIITVANQIKSFSAIFYQNPHLVSSFFGSIAKKTEKEDSEIFNKNHAYAPYYLAGLAFYRLETLFRTGQIDSQYRKIKFHLLMLFKMVAEEEPQPRLDSKKKIEQYCERIIKKLNNQTKCYEIFMLTIEIVESSSLDVADKLHIKQSSMVEDLIKTYRKMYA
ncbi:AIPR family protein [Pseudomonas sp. PAB10]|uniref:AIPR family protein n=1 Tax=Pseudomonas sp. PAB10 TaxID=3233047 RepID=UPI003F97F3BF